MHNAYTITRAEDSRLITGDRQIHGYFVLVESNLKLEQKDRIMSTISLLSRSNSSKLPKNNYNEPILKKIKERLLKRYKGKILVSSSLSLRRAMLVNLSYSKLLTSPSSVSIVLTDTDNTFIEAYMCVHICLFERFCIYRYSIFMYIYECMYACTSIYPLKCMHTYIYMYIYICLII
jgi:hypothetical protein